MNLIYLLFLLCNGVNFDQILRPIWACVPNIIVTSTTDKDELDELCLYMMFSQFVSNIKSRTQICVICVQIKYLTCIFDLYLKIRKSLSLECAIDNKTFYLKRLCLKYELKIFIKINLKEKSTYFYNLSTKM